MIVRLWIRLLIFMWLTAEIEILAATIDYPCPLQFSAFPRHVHCMEFLCHSHAIKNSTQQPALIYQLLKASNILSFAIGKNYILQVFNFATLVKIRNESFIEYQFFYF